MQKILIKFISEKLRKEFVGLRTGKYNEVRLHTFIKRAFEDIGCGLNCSTKIPRKLWSKEYKKYNIGNLWKYDLPNGWRLIYTLGQNEITVVAIILEWFSHKAYEKRFKY